MSAEEMAVPASTTPEAEVHRRGSDIGPKVARRIRVSGIFILLGMGIEAVSLLWVHPTAFLVYATFGGFCLLVGLVAYLFSLVFTK